MIQFNGLNYSDDHSICYGPIDNNIETVILHKGTLRIDTHAFYACPNLKRVDGTKCTQPIVVWETAFEQCPKLEFVDLNVEEIFANAFLDCEKEKGINFNFKNITNINSNALARCHIKSLYMTNTLTFIGGRAFDGAKFDDTTFILPDGLNFIGDMAFSDTNLKNIYLPDSCMTAGTIFYLDDVNIHVSQKLVDRFKLVLKDNIILEDNSLDSLLGKYTFKQLNDKRLEEEKKTRKETKSKKSEDKER